MAGFQVHKLQNEGDVMTKSDDFQRRRLSSVGRILGTQSENDNEASRAKKNDNCKFWKPIIHGYKNLHGGISTKMKITNMKTNEERYYLVDLLGWKH